MYEVEDIYFEILKQPVQTDSIRVDVTLKDGTVLELSDGDIVKNSLKITHELCREYRIGTFNLGVLKLGFFDSEALKHDFSGAEIKVYYTLDGGVYAENDMPMGIFLADGQTVKRRRDTVTLTAYDYGVLFDCTVSQFVREMEATAEGFLIQACSVCGVEYGGVHDKLPNREVTVTATSPQIQSYRDIIEWCAVLLCGYAVIDRLGRLKIISARYDVDEEDETEIITQKLLDSSERNSIYSTDTRAWIAEISAYCGDKRKIYRSEITQSDEQAARAVYTLEKNPLLTKKTTAECDEINVAWLSYIDGFKQRGITAEIYGDAALDAGDVMRCSEGDIDQRGSVVGLITRSEWCYRNFHRLECAAAQLSDGFPDDTMGSEIIEDYYTHEPITVSSQLEKKIEAVEATKGVGAFANEAKNAEVFNDYENYKYFYVGEHGDYSHSEGYDTYALGIYSHTEGFQSVARGKAAHAESGGITGMGGYEDSEEALLYSGDFAHAECNGFAAAAYSHAENGTSYGPYSHAECGGTTYGYYSHASGRGTKARGVSQTVIGQWNEVFSEDEWDNHLFIVGNGTAEKKRSNALWLDKNGNLHISGKFTADGGIEGGSGESYTAGDGINISASNEISAAIDGTTIVLDDSKKLKAVGVTIDNAIVIQEKDASYLIHEYSEVQYIAGNRVVYAGADNQIIVGGYVFVKDGTAIDTGGSGMYTDVTFAKGGNGAGTMVDNYRIHMTLGTVGTNTTNVQYWDSISTNAIRNASTYDLSRTGFDLYWTSIEPPSETHPYGYVMAKLAYAVVNSSGNLNYPATATKYFDFASEAEYNAAVGLTYEPVTLTQVNETVTEV